jgi:hypothetical protein
MSLERQYRRLLLAYPRSYRERRGEEIVATLLDDAEPGRTRPDGRAAFDLVIGGLRERLGLHDRDGFAAGAALVGPLALAFAVANAMTFPMLGLGGPPAVVTALVWVFVLAVRSVRPSWGPPAATVAVATTMVAAVPAHPGMFFVIVPWALVALIGDMSAQSRSVRDTIVVRLGVPVAVALLTAVTMWGPYSATAVAVLPALLPTWQTEGVRSLLALVAVVIGVAVAAWRRSGRLAWAAFLYIAVWVVSGGSLFLVGFSGAIDAVSGLDSGYTASAVALLGLFTAVVVVAAVRRGGPRLAELHRVGSVATGFVGGVAAVAALALLPFGVGPYASAQLVPLVAAFAAVALPALTDSWLPARAQRVVLGAAIVAHVGLLAVGGAVPAFSGVVGFVVVPLGLAMLTRRSGVRSHAAPAGVVLGVVVAVLAGVIHGPTVLVLPSLAWPTHVVAGLILGAIAVSAARALYADMASTWVAASAVSLGVLWVVGFFAPNYVGQYLVMCGVIILGLAAAQAVVRLRDRGGGPSSVTVT